MGGDSAARRGRETPGLSCRCNDYIRLAMALSVIPKKQPKKISELAAVLSVDHASSILSLAGHIICIVYSN